MWVRVGSFVCDRCELVVLNESSVWTDAVSHRVFAFWSGAAARDRESLRAGQSL
jgi:hypothetical protein